MDRASGARAGLEMRGAPPSPMVIFETARLMARQLCLSDLDFVAEMLSDPEVMRFYPKPYSRTESRGWIERQLQRYRDDGHGLWLIQDRASGEPVGQVGLLLQTVDGKLEPEIGYLIHRPFWRRGYASEAASATLHRAFAGFGYSHAISLIRPENIPSQGVARRLGMRPVRLTTFADLQHRVFAVSAPTPNNGLRGTPGSR